MTFLIFPLHIYLVPSLCDVKLSFQAGLPHDLSLIQGSIISELRVLFLSDLLLIYQLTGVFQQGLVMKLVLKDAGILLPLNSRGELLRTLDIELAHMLLFQQCR